MEGGKSDLYERYNFDDVFNRSVIVGLLNLMNNEISYDQIWQNDVVENVTVPCAYEFGSSDERFMQDNYTFFGKACFGDRKIDGKFDMLPRCYIKYTGSSIDAGNITNRFVQGRFMRREGNKIVSYIAQFYSVPTTLNFECMVYADNLITAFKIESAIREAFYKNKTYTVLYRGMQLKCSAGFPENATLEKTISYQFDNERDIKLTFNVAVESYQPMIDNTTEIEAGNVIEHIGYDIEHFYGVNTPGNRIMSLKFKDMNIPDVIPSGTPLFISWENESNVSDMCSISISYIDEEGTENQIHTVMDNQGYYIWDIPEDFSGYTAPDITYMPDDDIKIDEEPVFKIIPDNGKITASSFRLISGGRFSGNANTVIPMELSYIDKSGKLRICGNYMLNIVNGRVLENRPVMSAGIPMDYDSDVKMRKISLKITYPLNREIFDQIDNVLIL